MPVMATTFADALQESLTALGGVRTKAEIVAWIKRRRYPRRWKAETYNGHLYGCQVNNPKAYQYHPYKRKFVFFDGRGHYELYDAGKHGTFRNGHLIRANASPAADQPHGQPPPDSWIFQFLPDHNFDFESTLEPELVLTWHVGQHPLLMRRGQMVYLWRAAGKRKLVSGIIGTASIQSKPEVQQPFAQSPGGPREMDQNEPEQCAVLKIEKLFNGADSMLRKEVLLHDPNLKDLRILRGPNGTNFPLRTDQAIHIAELLGLKSKAAKPVYADFGEAPNDDPDELRTFAAKVRRGQPKFRNALLGLYGEKCAITGTPVRQVLEACHVTLHSKTGINRSDNGILLRSDIHELFDQGLIDIDPDTMAVVVDARIRESEYGRYHGQCLPIRSDGTQISKKYLIERQQFMKAP